MVNLRPVNAPPGRRSRLSWALVLLALLAPAACQRAPSGAKTDLAGSVRRFPVDSDNWVLVADNAPGEIYVPDALPEPFHEEGLRVRFAIERLQPAPNARLVGIPVRLLRLAREDPRRPS